MQCPVYTVAGPAPGAELKYFHSDTVWEANFSWLLRGGWLFHVRALFQVGPSHIRVKSPPQHCRPAWNYASRASSLPKDTGSVRGRIWFAPSEVSLGTLLE